MKLTSHKHQSSEWSNHAPVSDEPHIGEAFGILPTLVV